jgi:NADH:ubiquinone oxidoreductase subunit 6 (subunit J)
VIFELILFWSCCLCAIAGALGAATVRNLFHAALLLGLSLVGVAGLYLFLEASYVACVQVVVYVGGILVLMLFATLFSSDVMGAVQRTPVWLQLTGALGALLSGLVGVRLAQHVMKETMRSATGLGDKRGPTGVPDVIGGGAGTPAIGDLLTGGWIVPFLAAGVLLTVALVAAVATVQRFRRPVRPIEARHG